MAKENKKENKKVKQVDKKENVSSKDVDKGKEDGTISFNFSMKMDKDGFKGDGSVIPPKDMSVEDREDIARLVQKGIRDANVFMTRAQNEIMRERKRESELRREHRDKFNMFDIFNDGIFRDNRRGRY